MTRGVFSLVVAVYNVAPYLDEFLAAVEAQEFPYQDCQIIFVNDGSNDGSREIIGRWADRRGEHVTIIDQPNGGLASARNTGMRHASNTWVTFPDPDDVLAPGYLAQVHDFISATPDEGVSMYAGRILMRWDATGEVSDSHPLRRRFRPGNHVVNLDRAPRSIHLSAATAFLRRSHIARLGLEFDERIRPNFEDGALIARYLLHADAPTIGYVASATYHYRRRADAGGLVESGRQQAERYTVVPDLGYLATLRYAEQHAGHVPLWLQNVVLYELFWYFRDHGRAVSHSRSLPAETQREFHALVCRILEHVSPEAVEAFDVRPIPPHVKRALLVGYMNTSHRPATVIVDALDDPHKLVRLRYWYSGDDPAECIRVKGEPVRPTHCTTAAHQYFGSTLYRERILWVSTRGPLQVELDGHLMPLSVNEPAPLPYVLTHAEIKHGLERRAKKGGTRGRRKFRNAWLLMDRAERAGDNGELLYRYLREFRPGTNAWFVLGQDSADWDRLRADGFRLLEYGSARWRDAVRSADHLVASHLELGLLREVRAARRMGGAVRFTFCQHGPRGHESPQALNGRPIDLLLTATPQDYLALTQDGSPYAFTTREVRLTGLPRHDALQRLARSPAGAARTILVAPAQAGPGLAERWTRLLQSERLRALCEQYDLGVTLLSADSTRSTARRAPAARALPGHVHVATPEGVVGLEVTAAAAVLLTDDADRAFDASCLGRPVVYATLDGPNSGTFGDLGWFGPVATDLESALDETSRMLADGGRPTEHFESRMRQAFPLRDGGCCARIIDEVDRVTAAGLERPSSSVPAV